MQPGICLLIFNCRRSAYDFFSQLTLVYSKPKNYKFLTLLEIHMHFKLMNFKISKCLVDGFMLSSIYVSYSGAIFDLCWKVYSLAGDILSFHALF